LLGKKKTLSMMNISSSLSKITKMIIWEFMHLINPKKKKTFSGLTSLVSAQKKLSKPKKTYSRNFRTPEYIRLERGESIKALSMESRVTSSAVLDQS